MKPLKKKRRSKFLFLVFLFLVVIADWYLQSSMRFAGIGVENTGVSFGMGQEWSTFWSVALPIFLIAWVLYEIFGSGKVVALSFWLLVFGGIGNIVARIAYGFIWDYIQLPFTNLWLNLSDTLITASVFSYILSHNELADSL